MLKKMTKALFNNCNEIKDSVFKKRHVLHPPLFLFGLGRERVGTAGRRLQ